MNVKRLMLPSVTGFHIDPPRPANETTDRLVAHHHFCIPSAPFGDDATRIDAECVEIATGELFSLEIMPGWVRVYYGRWEDYTPEAQEERDAVCRRIRDDVQKVLA